MEWLNLLLPVALLIVGSLCGRILERRHLLWLAAREARWRGRPVFADAGPPARQPVAESVMVVGSVVLAPDYGMRLVAWIRMLLGGEVGAFARVLARARREALLRMRESRPDADCFRDCRITTSAVANGQGRNNGTVEVIAYATAIRYSR